MQKDLFNFIGSIVQHETRKFPIRRSCFNLLFVGVSQYKNRDAADSSSLACGLLYSDALLEGALLFLVMSNSNYCIIVSLLHIRHSEFGLVQYEPANGYFHLRMFVVFHVCIYVHNEVKHGTTWIMCYQVLMHDTKLLSCKKNSYHHCTSQVN